MSLSPAEVAAASIALSAGRFWFTRENLRAELVRRGAWPRPERAIALERTAFASELARHEGTHGALERLARPEALPEPERIASPVGVDVFDYAVRRVLVFDRIDPLLAFARSGFHRYVEVGMVLLGEHTAADPSVAPPRQRFPEHVWRCLDAQLEAKLSTTFYAVHDADLEGYGLPDRVRAAVGRHGRARVADVGLSLPHALELGVPVRVSGDPPEIVPDLPIDPEETRLLASGASARFDELTPLEAMRWVYGRIARRSDDAGFG